MFAGLHEITLTLFIFLLLNHCSTALPLKRFCFPLLLFGVAARTAWSVLRSTVEEARTLASVHVRFCTPNLFSQSGLLSS
jgi:hypothetical protein